MLLVFVNGYPDAKNQARQQSIPDTLRIKKYSNLIDQENFCPQLKNWNFHGYGFCRTTRTVKMKHMNFYFRSFPDKTNDFIFFTQSRNEGFIIHES